MELKLKTDPGTDLEELVKQAGGYYFYDNDGPNDYGEVLRLYQLSKARKSEYEDQYKNTFKRERELVENIKHAAIFLGIYVGLVVLYFIVEWLFVISPGTKNTWKGFLATVHFLLLFTIVIGAVLVAIPFTLNLLKQIYLYKMLTNPAHSLDDDREKFKVITLIDERRFVQGKITEYYRLFGAFEELDKECKGLFYSRESKEKADELMSSLTPQLIADMHSFTNQEHYNAKSIKGKESISAWWIIAGAMIPLLIALFAIASGLAKSSGMGF
ncbi:MAG: hypothetical protein K6C35_00920 [Eubacterium sp.]|nr:hypothetical protein [Eubacterium sp.]